MSCFPILTHVQSWSAARTRILTSSVLLVAVAIAMATSAIWVVRVPFMQGTDEQAHADYAFALLNGGGWFSAPRGIPEDYVTTQVLHLAAVSNFWQLRAFGDARTSPKYGTDPFFNMVDRSAPRLKKMQYLAGTPVPYVAYNNPVAYYVAVAAAMRLVEGFSQKSSLVAAYFGARALGVLFLGATLLLSYDTLRALRLSNVTSLLLTLSLGLFPLTSWVSAYLQPDTLTLLCVTLVLCSTLRWQARAFDVSRTAVLVLVLSAAFFVKTYYAAALTASCCLLVAGNLTRASVSRFSRLITMSAIIVVPFIAYAGAKLLTPVGHLNTPFAVSAALSGSYVQPPVARIEELGHTALLGVLDMYLAGNTFHTFWLSFGDLVTPYLASAEARGRVACVLSFLSLFTVALMAVRQTIVLQRLFRVSRKRWRAAVRLLLCDIVLNVYVVWTALLLAVFVSSGMKVYLEGRYFLPILLPTMLLSVRYVPRMLVARQRGSLATLVAACWATYSLVMSPIALSAMEQRFYGVSPSTPPVKFVRVISINRVDSLEGLPSGKVFLDRDTSLEISGLAVSVDGSHPVRSVDAELDKDTRLFAAMSNARNYEGVSMLKFRITTPARLGLGTHTISIQPFPKSSEQKAELVTITRL